MWFVSVLGSFMRFLVHVCRLCAFAQGGECALCVRQAVFLAYVVCFFVFYFFLLTSLMQFCAPRSLGTRFVYRWHIWVSQRHWLETGLSLRGLHLVQRSGLAMQPDVGQSLAHAMQLHVGQKLLICCMGWLCGF